MAKGGGEPERSEAEPRLSLFAPSRDGAFELIHQDQNDEVSSSVGWGLRIVEWDPLAPDW